MTIKPNTSDIKHHIVSMGDWGADFRCSPLVIDVLKCRKIFFGHQFADHPFPEDEILKIRNSINIEPYTSYSTPCNDLWAMGAFSYSISTLPMEVTVRRYCSIAENCRVFQSRHPIEWATSSAITYLGPIPKDCPEETVGLPSLIAAHDDFNKGKFQSAWPSTRWRSPPCIEHDVWIGQQVLLARGVTIGIGAVVGAGAAVTKNVEPYMIVGGVPARVIRPRFNEKLIERLLISKWWEYDPSIFRLCNYQEPERFLDDFEKLKEKNSIIPYNPEKITFKHIANDIIERVNLSAGTN